MFGLDDGEPQISAGEMERMAQMHFANELSGFIITVAAIYAGNFRFRHVLTLYSWIFYLSLGDYIGNRIDNAEYVAIRFDSKSFPYCLQCF